MGRRRRVPAYRAWLRRRPSLDRPEASVRLLIVMEATATIVVVALILTAVVVVRQHRRAVALRPPATIATGQPVTEPPPPAPAGRASTTPAPSTSPVAVTLPDATPTRGPRPSPSRPSPTRSSHSPSPPAPPPSPPAPPPPPPPPAGCVRASHQLTTQWPGGLQAQFTVANCGRSAIDGWTVTVHFSAGVTIQAWNAQASGGPSTVDFSALFYDRSVQPGTSVTFGFNALWSGFGTVRITGCSIAGGSCS